MGPGKEEIFRQRQLAFVGDVLDSFTRGIREHLAATRDSARRLVDLLGQADQGAKDDSKKLADLLSTIERHVNILTQKSLHLDRMAKRMGSPFSTFDPAEIVEEALLFSSRSAHVREVSLRLEAANSLPSICGAPLCVHFVVLMLVNGMLERVSQGGEITVRVGPAPKGVLIEVEGHGTGDTTAPGPSDEVDQYWSVGQEVVSRLGGELQPTSIAHHAERTSLFLPIQYVANTSEVQSFGQRGTP